jgi:hypothetical protein
VVSGHLLAESREKSHNSSCSGVQVNRGTWEPRELKAEGGGGIPQSSNLMGFSYRKAPHGDFLRNLGHRTDTDGNNLFPNENHLMLKPGQEKITVPGTIRPGLLKNSSEKPEWLLPSPSRR